MGRLTGCCCCFDLRDGARAVGITLLVLYGLGMVSTIAGMVMLLQRDDVPLTGATVAQLVIQYIVQVHAILMNGLLVCGVNQSRRGMILAWLIFSGIIFGLQSAAVVSGFIVVCIYAPWWAALLVLGVGGAIVGVFWYWFVVVLHYYQDLKEKNGFIYGR